MVGEVSSGHVPINFLGSPNSVQATAQLEIATANAYIGNLGALTATLSPPVISPVFSETGVAPAISVPDAPAMQQVVWVAPNIPDSFTGSLSIDAYMPDPFDEAAPVLSFPTAPVAFSEAAPDAPGVDLNFVFPSDLTVSMPAPPGLLSLSVSNFAGVTMPAIDTTLPELTAIAPSIREYTPGDLYTSGLLTSIKASLQDRIDNGGTGLAPDVENAIWDRGREREYRQLQNAVADLERMETLGYAFPGGVYLDARLKLQTEFGANMAGHSREVMIKQAELEQTNVLAALQQATQLEGALMNYTNQVEQRVFDSCKYATEAGIALYNARVQAYTAYLDAYKTKVAVYEAQVRTEVAKVEAFKAQISAEQAKAQINTALVDQYKVQADVALSAIEIYKAEIGAIQTKAEIEKIKIETFGEQVKAYAAKINAYTAGVEGFRASIGAETSKQEAFKAKVDAYSATVTAAVKTVEARIEEYKGRLQAKTVEWEGYKAAAQAESAKASAVASNNASLADGYKATVSGISAYNDTLTKQWQVAYEQAQRTAEIGVSAAKANADLYMTTRSLALDAAKVGAQVSGQLGAAALNATNWSSSVSLGESYNSSDSYSNSYSNANSRSISYNYNASV